MTTNFTLDRNKQIAQFLNLILADTYILYVKTQNFHWNIVDPRFYALHQFLEKQYEELAEAIDELAERIRILGERAPGTLKQFLDMTSYKESNGDENSDDMLQQLFEDHEAMCRHLRERIERSNELGDHGTTDLLTKRLSVHEKSAWMLRSHLSN
ncbi:putative DNA protection during starvation family protein [Candidatus Protochlamydia naegleriophila]|uniref:Putative DNA protection during starvation family protein n=1 Tax=Candidatus Protochlamydia naegleriophila TaxID=389348 RepID=A0A0U5K2L1_9BACT|nr:DNA starvation/stationary phase protection protein [Candidatus Protochlamydia naegleriophila]CUI16347.1 putative DNA protection during starvation family protein [Candidatus Protochlamydia naegleriophila]